MKNNNSYSHYRQTLAKLLDAKALAKSPLLVLKGNSDFIASLSIKTLRQQWQSQGWSIERLEGQNLSLERFLDAATASSMFEPARISFVHEAAQIPDLLEALKNLAQAASIKNPICLVFKGDPLLN